MVALRSLWQGLQYPQRIGEVINRLNAGGSLDPLLRCESQVLNCLKSVAATPVVVRKVADMVIKGFPNTRFGADAADSLDGFGYCEMKCLPPRLCNTPTTVWRISSCENS